MLDKKGSLIDPLYIIIFLLAFAISTVFALYILDEFELKVGDKLTDRVSAIDQAQKTILNIDYLYIFVLIGLITAMMIGGFMVQQNPIVFWLSFFLLIIFLVVTAILSNVWQDITATSAIAPTAVRFTIINLVMSHLGLVLTVTFGLVAIAMYAKWRPY